MAAKKIASRIQIPSHAVKVDNAINGFWKPSSPGEACQGIVGKQVESQGSDGKPNVFYMLRITNPQSGPIVQTGDKPVTDVEAGMVVGVGGRTLASFFETNPGAEVILVYLGLGPKKPGKNPAKLYDTYVVKESGDD
jgi:hypothetical protein